MTRLFGAVLALIVLCSANAASAACTSPAGSEGKYIYNNTHKVFQYCNDSTWVEMNIKPGSGSGGCTNPTAGEGEMIYNKDHQVLQGCAGNVWRVIGPGPNASGNGDSAGWLSVTTGSDHVCAIKPDNTLWCWGGIDWGKIGTGFTGSPQPFPIQFEAGSLWKAVSAGYVHTCGIKTDNTLWCWGQNLDGELGIGSTSPFVSYTALQVNGGGSWKSISAGYYHTCAIKTDDTLWCWGRNNAGMVGDNSTTQRNSPTQVNGGGTWKMVSAGSAHTCAIKSDDSGWCWGYNNLGQLGDSTNTQRNVPTAISGGGTWKVIDAGDYHTCGVKSDDSGYCWGSSATGQVGDNTTVAKNVPTALSGGGSWKTIDASTWFNLAYGHSCGIKMDDTAWCWGDNGGSFGSTNGYNKLGDGTITQRNVPTAVIAGSSPWKFISTGGQMTCGLRNNNALICWGASQYMGANAESFGDLPAQISGGGTWKAVAGGQSHTCGIKSDDTTWCWGQGSNSQLGTGAAPAIQTTPITISGGGAWKSISGGTGHTCGIKTDNTGWCWGYNGQGQIGDNSTTLRQVPTAISGGGTWKKLSAGQYHTCGIKSDDTLLCWGINSNGQLGDNSTTLRQVPTAISGGGTWKDVSAGSGPNTCAIKMDDTIWCWGQNGNGQIGNGVTGASVLVPTAVIGGGAWKKISTGSYHSCAIKLDDTAWCWGSDGSGAIGDTIVGGNRLSPTAVDGGNTWKNITAGGNHTCGLKSDDTIWCWGTNNYGIQGVGSGAFYYQQTPAIISAVGTWKTVEAGDVFTCAIKSDDTTWCWGSNNAGQLTQRADSSPYNPSGVSPNCVNPSKKTGTIVYNSTHNVLQLCNGIGWMALNASYTIPDPCAGSPAVGTVCLDGSKYAGMSGASKMFVTLADDATGTPWNNANFSNTVATGATSTSNGETNSQTIAATDADSLTGGTQPHQATMVCENLTAHGQTDWYLPSIDELTTLYTNRVAIGGFTNTWFWSSTEMDADTARVFRFNTGAPLTGTKGNIYYVRCVRK